MERQKHLPIYSTNLVGKNLFVEAELGQDYQAYLKQWLEGAKTDGAITWLLSCDREEGGPWAGLNEVFENLVLRIQSQAPELIVQHDYELASVLPSLRNEISIRYLNLTDLAAENEQGRYYSATRASWIVHGLVELFVEWLNSYENSPWIIICDRFGSASNLVHQFFVELIRRGRKLNITLVIVVSPAEGSARDQFEPEFLEPTITLDLPFHLTPSINKQKVTRHAQELEEELGNDPIKLEMYLPKLIRCWLLCNQPLKALEHQIRACSIYARRGLYEDALIYGEAAFNFLKQCPLEFKQKHWILYVKLYICYTRLGMIEQALKVVQEALSMNNSYEQLNYFYYQMAMLYAREFAQPDLAKAEMYLEWGLVALNKSDLSDDFKLFQTGFNRNGLALVRQRQGRYREAVELCLSHYKKLSASLKPTQYLLHRSTLLYNAARVYVYTGNYDEAINLFTNAIAMDSNYAEYYNERGNLFFKIGRLDSAMQDYLKAIELRRPCPEFWVNLGHCYRELGEIKEAIHAYSYSLDLAPDQASVLVIRAQTFEMLEQPEKALADYSRALAVNPNQSLVLANRAILHYDAGRYEAALRDLDSAIALSPENADLYQNRAVALIALRRVEEAMQDLNTYLRMNPDAEDRYEVEAQLLLLRSGN